MEYGKIVVAIVDDDRDTRSILNVYLSNNTRFDVLMFGSGDDLLSKIDNIKIDLILLDIEMPGLSGLQTYEALKGMDTTKNIPVIFLTGLDDKKTVLSCIGMGADGYLVKPVDRENLVRKIDKIIGDYQEYKSNKTILLVDDDTQFLKIMKAKLSKYYNVLAVNSGKVAMDYLMDHVVDLIILDYFMPLFDGKNVLTLLKKTERTKNIPVVMLSALTREEILTNCAGTQLEEAMTKNSDLDELLHSIKKLLDEE